MLEWLSDSKASWLYTGLFSDIERLKPEQLFDMDFLAAGLYAADRTGEGAGPRHARGREAVLRAACTVHGWGTSHNACTSVALIKCPRKVTRQGRQQ